MSEILHLPHDREIGERSHWLVTVRWLVVAFAAALVVVFHYILSINLPLTAIWATLGTVLLYNTAFLLITRHFSISKAPQEKYSLIINLQLSADLIAFTVMLHFTGGLENPFSAYYVLLVLATSMLASRRMSYIYAGAASILWVALVLLEASGIIPHYNLAGFRLSGQYTEPLHILAISVVLVSLNMIVALFATDIISRLRQGERQLYDANLACELRASELSELNAKLTELDRSRTMFMRLVTHELRAPVAAIQSYLRLILDGYVPPERLNEIIGRAEQRARDQLELIGDLLDLARAQNPPETAPPEAVDLSSVLQDVMELMQARAESKHLEVTMEAPPGMLASAEPEQTRQVWMNLISNAIKYTPEGGKIQIRIQPEGGMIRGSVRDTGIGMAPEELKLIFEPFYRTEAAKQTAAQGTGLGLSIVKEILTRYGGRIWVESVKGQGSTFYFELPQASSPA